MRLPSDTIKPAETIGEDFWIAVLTGSDASSGVLDDLSRGAPVEGNNDSWRLIPQNLMWSRCHISPSYFRQGRRWRFSECSVILNMISDPEQNPKTLRVAERITADFRDRLINDPRHIRHTRRDDVARLLQGTPGLHVPRVMRLRNPTLARLRTRVEAEGFSFPAIARRPGTQTGNILGLFQRPEDMSEILDGLKGEIYLTEFVNCRWSDGLYRKMRLFYVGGEVVLRHRMISDDWNIHASARQGIMLEREDLQAEERRFFEGGEETVINLARDIMHEAARRQKLDYFGMDCGPTEDGRFVLFEANPTMNIIGRKGDPRYEYARVSYGIATNALRRLMLRRAKPIAKD